MIELGLASAKESYRQDGSEDVLFRPVDGLRVLTVKPPDGASTTDIFNDITRGNGVLAYHSDESPLWVSCPDNPTLQRLLAEQYSCSEGVPADVEANYWTDNGPPTGA
jgi:hypothetical protein